MEAIFDVGQQSKNGQIKHGGKRFSKLTKSILGPFSFFLFV